MQNDNVPLMYNNTNNNNNLYAPYQSLAVGAHVDHHDVVTIPFTETKAATLNGGIALLAAIVCFFVTGALTGITAVYFWPVSIPIGILGFLATMFMFAGLKTIQPNSGLVCTLFGKYKGTEKAGGLRWMNPLYTVRTISLKLNNFETEKLKVNDKAGNPIIIGAVIVWKVVDTAVACFNVEDYQNYIRVQSEAALRNMATKYPYDAAEHEVSLRSSTTEISSQLQTEIQARVHAAGLGIVEARISHLAYSAEIAQAMLQRQQAAAIVAARRTIVEGAVGMVDHALALINDRNIVQFTERKKAEMVSNLLVVLCSERGAQPVVSTTNSAEGN